MGRIEQAHSVMGGAPSGLGLEAYFFRTYFARIDRINIPATIFGRKSQLAHCFYWFHQCMLISFTELLDMLNDFLFLIALYSDGQDEPTYCHRLDQVIVFSNCLQVGNVELRARVVQNFGEILADETK